MYQNNLSFACIPFNFSQLEAVSQQIGDIDTTLLYASLHFQISKSKLFSHGSRTIARSREQLVSLLKLTPSKIDKGVKKLETLNFIKKTVHKWYNKKRLFISQKEDAPEIEVHFKKLFFLNQFTGDNKASLLWAKIAFGLNNTHIEHENLRWCTLKRETIARLLCVSLRKVDSIISDLEQKGLIVSHNFVWREKRQLHFTIPQTLYEKIETELPLWLEQYNIRSPNKTGHSEEEAINQPGKQTKEGSIDEGKLSGVLQYSNNTLSQPKAQKVLYPNSTSNYIGEAREENSGKKTSIKVLAEGKKNSTEKMYKICAKPIFCRLDPAKIKKSIRLNNLKQYSNSTINANSTKKEKYDTSDISLDHINKELTYRQLCFLQVAFKKTIEKAQLTITNEEEILEEIKFSVLNPAQRKGVSGFKHAVSRCMQLLRQRTWRTPFGFHRYTEYGKGIKIYRETQLQAHEARKREESNHERKITLQADSYTAQAIRWAQQLSTYITEMHGKISNTADLMPKIEFAANRVLEFINKGADKLAIKPYLPAGILG